MGFMGKIKALFFGPEIKREVTYNITIPLTERNRRFIESTLRYKLGKMTGFTEEALRKIQELEEKRFKKVKVNVGEELDKLTKQRAYDIINKGSPIHIANPKDRIDIVSIDYKYLGRYHSFQRYEGLVYVVFYRSIGKEKLFVVMGGKPTIEELLTNPDTLDSQINDLKLISIRYDERGNYVPREIVVV
ncbi:MAG: hypothetical protein ACTSW1_00630 [Candidatus Hodarchaeales archaeon]